MRGIVMLVGVVMAALLGCHTGTRTGFMRPDVEHSGTLHVRGTCNVQGRIDQLLDTSWKIDTSGVLHSSGEWQCSPIRLTITAKRATMARTQCPERAGPDGGPTLFERIERGEIVPVGDGQYEVQMDTALAAVSQPVVNGATVCALEYTGTLTGP